MSSTKETQFLSNNEDIVISKKETREKQWKWESFFKVFSCVFYGFFFGMLPASFKFSSLSSDYVVEISSIVALLAIGLMSIMVIYWTFKGEIRKYLYLNYYAVHMLNAIILSIGVLVISFFPISAGTTGLKDVKERQLILMLCSILWALVMSLILFASFVRVKRLFPLSWSRIGYSQLVLGILSLMHVLIYLSAVSSYDNKNDNTNIFLILALLTYVLATILFVFALSYIKVYRDILLGERTDFEVRAIKDWDDAKVLSIITSTIASIVFIYALIMDKIRGMNVLNTYVYSEIIVDALLLLVFFGISFSLKLDTKNNKTNSKISSLFKSIDYIVFLETFVWIILVKSAVIQGILITTNDALNYSQVISLYISSAITFGSVMLLYIVVIIMSINVPNLKNVALSISSVVASILLSLFTLTFTATFAIPQLELTEWLPLFMLLTMVLGTTISLIIRIYDVSKIFKSSAFEQKILDTKEAIKNKKYSSANAKKEEEYIVDIETTKETKMN